MTRKRKEVAAPEVTEEVIIDAEPEVTEVIDESVKGETPVEVKQPEEDIKLTGNSVQELQVAIRKLL